MIKVPVTGPQLWNFDDWCDECQEYGRIYWMVPTGEIDERFNCPVIQILCEECKRK